MELVTLKPTFDSIRGPPVDHDASEQGGGSKANGAPYPLGSILALLLIAKQIKATGIGYGVGHVETNDSNAE